MSALLLPNEILSMSAQAARRLVEAGDGDAALLYLAMLERGGDARSAGARLRWSQERVDRAWDRLTGMELAEKRTPAPEPAAPKPEDSVPEYSQKDLTDALDQEPQFQGLYQEVERILSRPMSDSDLKCLYVLYDSLGLSPEVILMLAGYVARKVRRLKNSPGARPRMPQIQREGFRWKRLGIDTVERAEEYLRREELTDQREWKILSIIGVKEPRAAVEREREYIQRWVTLGLSDALIALAYERTVFQKKEMNWAYMNKILLSWHEAGYTTPEQARQGDRPPQRRRGGKAASGQESVQPSTERIRKNADWLDQFLEEQRKGT